MVNFQYIQIVAKSYSVTWSILKEIEKIQIFMYMYYVSRCASGGHEERTVDYSRWVKLGTNRCTRGSQQGILLCSSDINLDI
jgi:hypothetical protein